MSTFEDLKASFKRRLLTAAHEHLFGHLETTLSGYEKELDRRRNLLQMITNPDVQQLLATKKRALEIRTSLDQDDPEPGAEGEDCGGSRSDRNSQPDTNDKASNVSEAKSNKAQTDPARKWFTCSVCSKRFRYKWYLVVHMRVHTGEKPYSCCVCGKRWTHKSRLNCHLKTHTHCSVCGKEFGLSTRSAVSPFSCCVAEKRFRSVGDSSELRRGQTKKAVSERRSFSCSYCGRRFGLEKPLQVHMRVHSEEKLVCCSGCGQIFPRRESFHHMSCLRRKKLIRCSLCESEFESRKSLVQHIGLHDQKETHDSARPEPARNTDPDQLGGPGRDHRTFDFSELDTDDESCKERTRVKQEQSEPPHIKEEQEEVWSGQEGEQLEGLEEADINKFPFSPVPVKTEDDEEKPQSSQLHQSQTEDNRDSDRGSEPHRTSGPHGQSGPGADSRTSDSSECDTDESDFWKETRNSVEQLMKEVLVRK